MPESTPLNLRYARDVKMFWSLNRRPPVEATLTGQVTRRKRHKDGIFLSLHDASGVIECFARKITFPPEEFESNIAAIRKGDRVTLRGPVETRTSRGRSQPIVDVRTVTPSVRAASEQANGPDNHFAPVESGFFLARLKRRVATDLLERGFEELVPRYIHNLKPEGRLEPLQVVFPGYGSPAYLLVSPLPDLRAAALVTGIRRAFSVARSYSQTVRDGYTSAESLVVGLVLIGDSPEALVDLCIDLVCGCLGDYGTMAANWSAYAPVGAWARERMPDSVASLPAVSNPTILDCDQGAFALAWSRPADPQGHIPEPLLLVEGATQANAVNIAEGTAIIHIERMAKAISDEITLRT